MTKISWIIPVVVAILVLATILILPSHKNQIKNAKPLVFIDTPRGGERVYGIVILSGRSKDPDGEVKVVEVKVDDGEWEQAHGTLNWSFYVDTKDLENGWHTIYVRSFDGHLYSEIARISLLIENEIITDVHRWGLFVAVANVEDIETKLGNGMLNLAEDMARYFISNLGYPASHITILFDDGWIRDEKGERICTLQDRVNRIDYVTYGPATKDCLVRSIEKLKEEANRYRDSEVFIWISGHGVGEEGRIGRKLIGRSEVVLWDSTITDRELGNLLDDLKAELCLIVDACYSGEFANRLIFGIPSILKSGIPRDGRIVITGESRFSKGYASTISGPLFTRLWFEGLKTGKADGFKGGVLKLGRRTHLRFFRDGRVSVEEAFYYARCMIRKNYKEFILMQPQINDCYPYRFPFNMGEMFLGD